MDLPPAYHHEFAKSASRWSQNLVATASATYSPNRAPHLSNGLCIRSSMNNQVEYDGIIGLLVDSHRLGINHLHLFLDSQLVVSQLNMTFQIYDPYCFRKYLHAQRLARYFYQITFTHILRDQNHIVYHITNQILD